MLGRMYVIVEVKDILSFTPPLNITKESFKDTLIFLFFAACMT